MATKKTKQTSETKIFKRGDGRWAVQSRGGKWIRGEAKIKILTAAGKIPAAKVKKATEAATETPAQ